MRITLSPISMNILRSELSDANCHSCSISDMAPFTRPAARVSRQDSFRRLNFRNLRCPTPRRCAIFRISPSCATRTASFSCETAAINWSGDPDTAASLKKITLWPASAKHRPTDSGTPSSKNNFSTGVPELTQQHRHFHALWQP